MKISVFLIAIGAFELCVAKRILFFLPISSRSHYILQEPLMEELVRKGHEITVAAPYKKSNTFPNITEIILPNTNDLMFNSMKPENSADGKFGTRNFNPLTMRNINEMGKLFAEKIMSHPPMKKLLNSKEKFHLVVGICVMQEGLVAGLAHKFKAPMALISPLMPFSSLSEIAGNPAPSSYIPEVILGYSDKMTFLERLSNSVFTALMKFLYFNSFIPLQDSLMRKHFGEDLPPLKDLMRNNSIYLINHHFSLAFPRPYIPNMIEIGGYHVRPAKPLPKDIQKFMDEADDGVIFFSMGSNLRSDEFPKEKFDGILKAFSRLKQRVLWKFENENPPNLSKNVKISKWLPQSDVLAHPNVRLFITHGGLLSITESIFRGVPVVGIPIFGDQPANVKLVQKIGVGVKLDFDDINEESLYKSVQEVLSHPKYVVYYGYTENAKFRSSVLRDRPLQPLNEAVYWLEYVMRYNGTPHIKSGALDLAWYQLYMLDVLAFLGVVLYVFVYCVKKICCCLLKTLRGGKKKNVSTNKKNN